MFRAVLAKASVPARSFSTTQAMLKGPRVNTELAKHGLSRPPKASPTPYALFVKDRFASDKYKEFTAKPTNNTVAEFARVLGEEWVNLSEAEKAPFVKAADDAAQAWKTEFKAYWTPLSLKQRAIVKEIMGKKLRFPGTKQGFKDEERVESGMPKRSLSAFFLYVNEVRQSLRAQGLSEQEVSTTAGANWKEMSEEKKRSYHDAAKKAKDEYDAKVAELKNDD